MVKRLPCPCAYVHSEQTVTVAGSIVGLRAGSAGAAASAGMLFLAASVAMDMSNGQLRVNVYNEDPTPVNPHAHKLSLPKY